jgi:flavin-binding protein dodecin
MSDYIAKGAIKVIEVIGVSEKSWEDAVGQAVAKASESVKGITGVEVTAQTARVSEGKVVQYNATVKLAFVVA